MRVRLLNLSTWPLADGASLVNLEQLADSTEKLALEIPPETRKELIDRGRDGNLSRLGTARGCIPPTFGPPSPEQTHYCTGQESQKI